MSEATLTGMPPIWTPEWGFLWENIANYALFLGFMGGYIKSFISVLFVFLKSQVNKIQFDLPLPRGQTMRIDFSKYAWDDEFFDHLESLVMTKVDAKTSQAKAIKLKYQSQITAATTEDEKSKCIQNYQDALEQLSDDTIEDIKTFNPQLFQATITRFGKEQAENYLRDHVKATVVQRKNGSAERVSMTETLKNLEPLPTTT